MSHLQLVNGRYRVRIVVPRALRPVIGRESLCKSLGTSDRAKANRLAAPYIAEFTARLAHAASQQHHYNGVWSRIHSRSGLQYHNNVKPKRHYNSSDAESAAAQWLTPPKVFDVMGAEFDMDVASPGAEVVPWIPAKRHLTTAEDGLKTSWEGFIWCNPPYGLHNGMQAWITKFVAHRNGVILLPGYTYTHWFQEFIVKTHCILFPWFKLQFINPALPPEKRNCTLSNCLAAIGEKGTAALHRAAQNGFGSLLVSAHPVTAAPSIQSDV
jgi:hypothetical protein